MNSKEHAPQAHEPYRAPDSKLTDERGPSPPWDDTSRSCAKTIVRRLIAGAVVTAFTFQIICGIFVLLEQLFGESSTLLRDVFFRVHFSGLIGLVLLWGVFGTLAVYVGSNTYVYFLSRSTSVLKFESQYRRYFDGVLGHPLAVSGTFVLLLLAMNLGEVALDVWIQSDRFRVPEIPAALATVPFALVISYPIFKVAILKVRESLDVLGSISVP